MSHEEPDEDFEDADNDSIFEGTCNACQGTGQEYEGDVVVGDCQVCGGSGFND